MSFFESINRSSPATALDRPELCFLKIAARMTRTGPDAFS